MFFACAGAVGALMSAWLLALVPKAIDLVMGLLGMGKDKGADTSRELGRDEQQIADTKGDLATVRKATEAAKKAEADSASDANDLDARR